MQYDFNLSPNGAQFIDVAGKFFKYKNGAGLIRVRNSKGGYVDLLPGQGVSGLDFTSLNITDMTGGVNKGVLLAGDYEFRDDRITGDVVILDSPGSGVQTLILQNLSIGMVVQTIIMPAANMNGVIIRSVVATIKAGASGQANIRMIAAPITPTVFTPTSSLIIAGKYDDSGTTQSYENYDLKKKIFPGWGVYVLTNISTSAAILGNITTCFEIL